MFKLVFLGKIIFCSLFAQYCIFTQAISAAEKRKIASPEDVITEISKDDEGWRARFIQENNTRKIEISVDGQTFYFLPTSPEEVPDTLDTVQVKAYPSREKPRTLLVAKWAWGQTTWLYIIDPVLYREAKRKPVLLRRPFDFVTTLTATEPLTLRFTHYIQGIGDQSQPINEPPRAWYTTCRLPSPTGQFTCGRGVLAPR